MICESLAFACHRGLNRCFYSTAMDFLCIFFTIVYSKLSMSGSVVCRSYKGSIVVFNISKMHFPKLTFSLLMPSCFVSNATGLSLFATHHPANDIANNSLQPRLDVEALVKTFNRGLASIKASGELKNIYVRYGL